MNSFLKPFLNKSIHLMAFFLMLSLFLLNACVVTGQQKGTDDEIVRANVDLAAEYYRVGKIEFALQSVNKALKVDPEHVEANMLIALIYIGLESNEKAKKYYGQVEYSPECLLFKLLTQ